jgi:TonB-linked SusC/RagA family outer membrane protein
MKKYLFCLVLTCFLGKSVVCAQGRQVTGVVRDKDGGLPSVSIFEKGMPTNGTSTDLQGRFKLALKGNTNVIIVSLMGYTTREIGVGNQTNLVVELVAEENVLNDVVVVGYGTQKKATLTGAISTVKGTDIQRIPTASLQNALTGKMPGFTSQQRTGIPGQDGAAFFIRGQSSFMGNNQPLILVDDIEYSYNQFSRLDANEIENISILKDASSTAIFGIKGANGVVLVTTRRGKIGKPKITVKSEFSLSQPTIFPRFLDSYETAVLYNQAQINDNSFLPNPVPDFKPRFTPEDLRLFQTGEDPWGHPNVDWRNVLFNKFAKQSRSNVDISGGTDKVKYFVSAGFLQQGGMLKDFGSENGLNTDYYYKRYNYRSNLDIKATNTLDVRLDLYGNVGERNEPRPQGGGANTDIFYDYNNFKVLAPFAYNIYNPNGSYSYAKVYPEMYSTINNVVGRLSNNGYDRNFENNIYLAVNANQKLNFITEGLSFKGVVSYASMHSYNRDMGFPEDATVDFPSFYYDRTTNTYTPFDVNTYKTRRSFLTYSGGNPNRRLNMQAFLNYDKQFGNHHLFGLVLANQQTNVAFVSSSTTDVNKNYIPANTRGYAGRLGYDYKRKYLIEFNGAYNGTDAFSSGNAYGFFPAISAGWNIAREPFFRSLKPLNWIDNFKIRGSYGIVGSDDIGNAQTSYLHEFNNSGSASFGESHANYTGIQEGNLGNDDVTWEKERKFSIGTDITAFKDRLSITLDYFDHLRYDIITARGTMSAMFGASIPMVNVGEVKNSGYEIEIGYQDKIGKDFSYSVSGNMAYVKNTILNRDEPILPNPWQQATGNSIGQLLVYKWIGFYTAADITDPTVAKPTADVVRPGDLKLLDYNNDGLIDDNDRGYFGLPNYPTTSYAVTLGFSYKGISINAMFQGAKDFYLRGIAGAIQTFSSNMQPIHRETWTPELGDRARYPVLSQKVTGVSAPADFPSTFWFIPGDFVRLKSFEVGYQLPKSWSNSLKLQDARIYATGYNLITWSKLTSLYQFDPEASSGNDRVSYPPQRTFNLGVSLTF